VDGTENKNISVCYLVLAVFARMLAGRFSFPALLLLIPDDDGEPAGLRIFF
jgi:hypothetical protein